MIRSVHRPAVVRWSSPTSASSFPARRCALLRRRRGRGWIAFVWTAGAGHGIRLSAAGSTTRAVRFSSSRPRASILRREDEEFERGSGRFQIRAGKLRSFYMAALISSAWRSSFARPQLVESLLRPWTGTRPARIDPSACARGSRRQGVRFPYPGIGCCGCYLRPME